jgi:hypothetical protein
LRRAAQLAAGIDLAIVRTASAARRSFAATPYQIETIDAAAVILTR